MMNEDLYDTGSAVAGLYGLFTNFLKFPRESPDPQDCVDQCAGGGGGGGAHRTFHSYPSFFTLLSIKTNYSRSN